MKVFLVPHFHYDLEWVRTKEEFEKIALRNIELVLKIMRRDPEYKFVLDQGILLEAFRERRPSLWQELLSRIREGRIEVVCGMYVMPDTLLPGAESLIRNLIIGKEILERISGRRIETAWMIDVFGHNFQIPQVMRKAGIKHYVMMRGYRGPPSMDFIWEGLDGSEVHVHHMILGYHSPAVPEDVEEGSEVICEIVERGKKYSTQGKLMIPIGADFRTPNPNLVKIAKRTSEKLGLEVRVSTPSEYFSEIDLGKLPRVRDLLEFGKYFRVLPGCYSSRIYLKRRYRGLERRVISAEALEAFCQVFGRRPVSYLEAWKTFLQNSFHDVICGCGIDQIYSNAEKRFREVEEFLRKEIEDCMFFLAERADTSTEGIPVVVFNPLPYERRAIFEVEVDLSSYEAKDVLVLDPEGNEVPSEVISEEEGTFNVLLEASLPPLGYEVLEFLPREERREEKEIGEEISCGKLKATFDQSSGTFDVFLGSKKVVSMGNDVEVVTDSGDLYYFQEPEGGYRGKVSKFLGERPYEREVNEIRYEVRGVRSWKSDVREAMSYRIRASWGSTTLFEISYEVSAFRDLGVLSFSGSLNFHYPHTMLRACFPTEIEEGEIYSEIPAGVVRREKEIKCGGWIEHHPGTFAVQDWMAYEGGGIGVGIINDGLPEHKLEGSEIKITLIRSVDLVSWGNAGPKLYTPGALGIGRHSFQYFLVPYSGSWREANLPVLAQKLLFPVFYKEWERGRGDLGYSGSLLRLEEKMKLLSCFPYMGGISLRAFEPLGLGGTFSLEVYSGRYSISEANLLGEAIGEFRGEASPYEIKTLLLRPRR